MVRFASGRDARRRVAGVPAVARIARELAETGFATVWIATPDGEPIDAAAMQEVRRLARSMTVDIGEPPPGADVASFPGDRLISAPGVAAFLGNAPGAPAQALDLTAPGASAQILRKTSKATDGPVSRWLNRPVSRALSGMLLQVPGLRPIHATAGNALLALLMFGALVLGGPGGLIAGGLLFQAASIFDGVDGEMARATFRASAAGAALDTAIDTATTVLFLVGLIVNLVSSGNDGAVLLGGWGLGLFALGLALIGWRASRVGGSLDFFAIKQHYLRRFSGPVASRLMRFATIVTSRDFFALLFALLVVAGLPMAVLYIFAAAASVWIWFVAALALRFRPAPLVAEGRS